MDERRAIIRSERRLLQFLGCVFPLVFGGMAVTAGMMIVSEGWAWATVGAALSVFAVVAGVVVTRAVWADVGHWREMERDDG